MSRDQRFHFLDALRGAGQNLYEARHSREIEARDHRIMVVLDQELTRFRRRAADPIEFGARQLEPNEIGVVIGLRIGKEQIGRGLFDQSVRHLGRDDVLGRLGAETDDAVELADGLELVGDEA